MERVADPRFHPYEEINTLDAKRDEALSAFEAQIDADRAELATETSKRESVFVTLPAQSMRVVTSAACRP